MAPVRLALSSHIASLTPSDAVDTDMYRLLVNRSWKPALSTTGVDGIPHTSNVRSHSSLLPLTSSQAGNVLRTHTVLTLSIRLPPTVDPNHAAEVVKAALCANPPYGAHVSFNVSKRSPGWESPALAPWLQSALDKASSTFFGDGANYIGEGGSIPFMGMLGKRFPNAQFVITGVLGPERFASFPSLPFPLPFSFLPFPCATPQLPQQCPRPQRVPPH